MRRVSLSDIAFPYKAQRGFGATSLALVFLLLLAEIELMVFGALAVAGHGRTFVHLQPLVLPAAALVSLSAAFVFSWRARAWTKGRMASVLPYTSGSSAYALRLAERRRSQA